MEDLILSFHVETVSLMFLKSYGKIYRNLFSNKVAFSFIKGSAGQVFSCEFCISFKSTYFVEQL